jgi:hypothetical protein
MSKARKKTVSAMHQRIRERLPHLSVLVDSADTYRTEQAQPARRSFRLQSLC